MSSTWAILVLSIGALLHCYVGTTEAQLDIGVNYRMEGDNLPSPATVVQLLKNCSIRKVRLPGPNFDVLNALSFSGIDVTLGIDNKDVQSIASSDKAARIWFGNYVLGYAYSINFQYITVGEGIVPGELAKYVLPAMQKIQALIDIYQFTGMRVSTVVRTGVLGSLDPPSSGAFSDEARSDMVEILNFLSNTSSPLLVNVYPYYAYAADPDNVRLDYCLLTETIPLVHDGNLSYSNMLDANVDAFYWAMEKEGVYYVDVVVSESGWPSAGNDKLTTPLLAQAYNQHFVKKFLALPSTPKRPHRCLEGFIYAMFNENQRPSGVDQNWGMFHPDGTPVYPVFSEEK